MPKFNFETPEKLIEKKANINRISNVTQKEDFLHASGDRQTFIHQACRLGCDVDTIESYLDEFDELKNLEYKDQFGMTPLHHACRHQPKNLPLIRLLLDKRPESVSVKDKFGR